jgi:hypothetical protein
VGGEKIGKMNSSDMKPGYKTLRGWLWMGACVVLVVVITVPVWQLMNTLDIINNTTEKPSTTVSTSGLVAFLTEELTNTPSYITPGTPPSSAKPAILKGGSSPVYARPANIAAANIAAPGKAGVDKTAKGSSTFVINYTDYVTYFFNTPVINKAEVTGNEPFGVCISANVTFVKDIPFSINSANLTISVYATDTAGSISIPLIISGNSVSFCVPDSKGVSTTFSQQIILRSPQDTLNHRYHLKMSISDLAVGLVFGVFHVGFSQPDEMYDLGDIDYRQLTP